MSRKIRRRRKGERPDDDPANPLGEALSEKARQVAREAARPTAEVSRKGPVQAVRRTDQARREQTAPPPTAPRERLDLSGLEELARMDRGDLDALMGGADVARRLAEGDRIQATITRVSGSWIFLDVGLKAEAILDRAERPGAEPGETLEAFVVWTDGEETRLSTKLSGATAAAFLDQAHESGIPVEGRVQARNRGGFTVQLGGTTAFCPVSHIDRIPGEDLDRFVGETLSFLVIETGEKTVVSRRALQERDLEAVRAETWSRLDQGQEHQGTITGVQAFGVFVDIGGVDGLIPRTHAGPRGADLQALYRRGDAIRVRVLSVDRVAGQVALSPIDPPAAAPETPSDDPDEAAPAPAGSGGFGTMAEALKGWKS
jgi:predicted RNA-binding protein with RPS1 domain